MAYKFQAGDATLSGSVTLVAYQDLLFESDGVSDIGTAASEVGVTYTTRLTASVGISGSAIYANNYYGNGSNLTGLSTSTVSVTSSALAGPLNIVLVQGLGSNKTLAGDSATGLIFQPSTNALTTKGAISGSGALSALDLTLNGGSWAADGDLAAGQVSGSDSLAGKSLVLGQNGVIGATGDTDLITLSTNSVVVAGAISGSTSISGKSVVLGQNGNIGAQGDTDLITLTSNLVAVAGAISGSGALSAAGNVQLDGADDSAAFVAADNVYFRDAGDGLMKRDSWSDIMTVAAGTAATTGLANSSGVLNFRPASLTEATIVTTDYLVFADANDSDNPKKEAVDDVAEILPALCDEAAIAVNTDYLSYIDGGVNGSGAKTKISSFVAAIADGTTISASNGQLSVLGAQNIDVDTIGNASRQLTSMGVNYATASITVDRTFTLPASPSSGDVIYVKFAGFSAGKHAVISGSGMQLIDGATAITASSAYASVSLVYVASNVWRIF